MKLAIIDLDGVVADSSARFQRAQEIRQRTRNDRSIQLGEREQAATEAYYEAAFDPEQVKLDTPIEGAPSEIDVIGLHFAILYLTSRPSHMRAATKEWLKRHDLPGELITKPGATKYVKTPTWKAAIVAAIIEEHEDELEEIIIIDDEKLNRDYIIDNTLFPTHFVWSCYASLEHAVNALEVEDVK